ncbi:MAG: PQQ-dependent sugar dehydrogenase, partial [Gemmatimonadaceae bacterium]|nr:PQQ-dependent sugar dehydrogenase [Gemmatimonadaceae bacterium]
MPTLRLLAPLLAVAAVALVVSAIFVASSDPDLETGGEGASVRLVEVVSGLDSPTYVTVAPGEPGRLYVVEQPGRIRVVENGALVAAPFLDITAEVRSGGEQGLLSVAFHPGYARNGLFYVDYTDRSGDTRVVEFRANGNVPPVRTRELFFAEQPYPNHNGGQLEFAPDGRLLVGMGDGGKGGDPGDRAQDLTSPLGKLLAFDTAVAEPEPQLLAYGLRNPWRFSFDRTTGELWIADVGQDEWEEVNVLPAAQQTELVNFGWDVREGLEPYEDKPLNDAGRLVDPVAVYDHTEGCSITGGYVYRGPELPDLEGRYLYGDYCSGSIWSLALTPDGEADVRREQITL